MLKITTVLLVSAVGVLQPSWHAATTSQASSSQAGADAGNSGGGPIEDVGAFRLEGKSETLNQFYGQTPAATRQFLINDLVVEAIPPHYYRAIRKRLDSPVWRQTGFARTTLLNLIRLPGAREEPGWTGPDAMRSARAECTRLMILLFFPTHTPVGVTAVTNADGTVGFSGNDDFRATLKVDRSTGLPIALIYPVRMVSSEEIREYVTTIQERRTFGDRHIPTRLTTTVADAVFERIALDSVNLKAELTPAHFERNR